MTTVRLLTTLFAFTAAAFAQTEAAAPQETASAMKAAFVEPPPQNLLGVKRIYVEQLSGCPAADALRALIISSLDATKLFVLTDNRDRADAILKGAADDKSFTDSFDSDESLSTKAQGGHSSGSGLSSSRSSLTAGVGVGDNESHHIKERKHEAYAAVRLCNRDGDVLWSTNQESLGAKFRGASADVAAKVARQITLDMDRERQTAPAATTTSKP